MQCRLRLSPIVTYQSQSPQQASASKNPQGGIYFLVIIRASRDYLFLLGIGRLQLGKLATQFI